MAKKGLGKGLEALFEDNQIDESSVSVLKISEIEPNKTQPRTDFDEEALRELADSIRIHGVLQPLVVRPMDFGGYQIVAGERRWRASRMAGLKELPVVIRELNDEETLEIAIIENLQREDLNAVELALGYQALMEQYTMTQEQVAEKVGKSRPVIANTLRLLNLPDSVLQEVRVGNVSAGHAKALLSLENSEQIETLAERIVKEGLLVRDVERIAKKSKSVKESKRKRVGDTAWGNPYYKEMELALEVELGRKVTITGEGKKGVLTLEFYNEEELNDIVEKLTK